MGKVCCGTIRFWSYLLYFLFITNLTIWIQNEWLSKLRQYPWQTWLVVVLFFAFVVLLPRGLFFHGTQPVTITWGVGQSPLLNPLLGDKRFFLLEAALCRENFSYYGTAALCCDNNNALNFVVHGLAREKTDLRLLLLHGQYCYYMGFVLHCIKIVWVHKQPKHCDSWAKEASIYLSLSIQRELSQFAKENEILLLGSRTQSNSSILQCVRG